jgi:putative restriction endonuclease
LFVITYPAPNANSRDIRLGWVEDWDDEARTFLIGFGERPPAPSFGPSMEEEPFQLVEEAGRPTREVATRPGQQRFKFRVLKRYGPRCAVCGLDALELLDAAHLRPKHEHGTDDPRNGLVFCPTHHRAFDAGFFAIEPETTRIIARGDFDAANRLRLAYPSLDHLRNRPHPDALRWAWDHRRP